MNKKLIALFVLLIFLLGCSSAEATPEAATATVPPTAEPTVGATAVPPTPTPVPDPVDEVIEYEMRSAFNFFWEQANTDPASPGYGLVRDRFPGSPGIASIASVGFGLTAYPIGVEKGYITYDEGYERVNGTLDTLRNMDRTEGFYYHFVDMATGERAWQSEVSSIDTTILMMGVVTAGQYFGGDIQEKAQQIYDEVNWPWFLDESRNMFYMAYRPGEGYGGHWDFYAEQLMLYVLAAGSDTHPIDKTPYYTFNRHYGKYGDGDGFIHSWFGSLFTYQFSHAWIDFRGYSDEEGVNWFNNSVAASQAQVDFALANADNYNTIGPNAWGLTASDGPDGYNGLYGAPPSGFDNNSHKIDDTIAPAGAIGSIIFVPEAAKNAMLNYYSIDALQGAYGFLDAYNLSEDWFASDVIGIDKGISLLMLANYQSDMVHQITMSNEQILNGLSRLGLTKEE
ncbi:MAG: glucoamylase family protein [Chloroflexota bacterium]